MDEFDGPPTSEPIIADSISMPTDLYGMYIQNRASMSTCFSSNELYSKLMFSIEIGKEMLPEKDEYDEIREDGEEILTNAKYYPGKRTMESDSRGRYKLTSTNQKTGLIYVRVEEITQGTRELINQQCSELIPGIRKVDNKIFKSLIDEGIITTKRPTLDDMFDMMLINMYDSLEKAKVDKETMEDYNELKEERVKELEGED